MVLHRRAAALGVQCRAELPVGDCVLPKADERPQQADDPEALCFHHDAVHRLLPDHAAGHLGQRTDRHVVLEQQVQVRRALAGAALEQGVQHSLGQPAQRTAAVVQLAQRQAFSRSQGPALPILQKPKYFQHPIKKQGNVLTFAESLAIV